MGGGKGGLKREEAETGMIMMLRRRDDAAFLEGLGRGEQGIRWLQRLREGHQAVQNKASSP